MKSSTTVRVKIGARPKIRSRRPTGPTHVLGGEPGVGWAILKGVCAAAILIGLCLALAAGGPARAGNGVAPPPLGYVR
jgi:hypothetical protein